VHKALSVIVLSLHSRIGFSGLLITISVSTMKKRDSKTYLYKKTSRVKILQYEETIHYLIPFIKKRKKLNFYMKVKISLALVQWTEGHCMMFKFIKPVRPTQNTLLNGLTVHAGLKY